MSAPAPHPAAFPAAVLDRLRLAVPRGLVLDPFGGVGRLGLLGPGWRVVSLDIEREWASQGPGNGCALSLVADARRLPFADGSFDAVATSPAYGNRMADAYAPPDFGDAGGRRSHRTRRSYRLALGRPLHPANGGGLQWGPAYRELHAAVLAEAVRTLRPGGTFVLNVKDHARAGALQGVPAWWAEAAGAAGLRPEGRVEVPLRGDRNTVRMRGRGLTTVDHELILTFSRPEATSPRRLAFVQLPLPEPAP